ncbi:hypothetical protein ABVL22_004275 [Salmonella enterica]
MKSNKSTVVSFRLSEDEFKPYAKILEGSTLSRSEFFRSVFLQHKFVFTLKEKPTPDFKKCVFYYNKASNNLNQLAHRVNSAHQSGIVNENLFFRLLNALIDIRNLLENGLKYTNNDEGK